MAIEGYVKIPAHMAKESHELWLPCASDVIPLSIHMTSVVLYHFADGDLLCGVLIENEAEQELLEATNTADSLSALAELHAMGLGSFWLGKIGEEASIKQMWPELDGMVIRTDEEGIEHQLPVFPVWGGVQ